MPSEALLMKCLPWVQIQLFEQSSTEAAANGFTGDLMTS